MKVLDATPDNCTDLLRLHTDRGVSILEITPSHRIQILGGGTCEAKKLSEGHWVMCSDHSPRRLTAIEPVHYEEPTKVLNIKFSPDNHVPRPVLLALPTCQNRGRPTVAISALVPQR
jgi:hypothetical protein